MHIHTYINTYIHFFYSESKVLILAVIYKYIHYSLLVNMINFRTDSLQPQTEPLHEEAKMEKPRLGA